MPTRLMQPCMHMDLASRVDRQAALARWNGMLQHEAARPSYMLPTWTSAGLALGDGIRLGGSGSEASKRPMKTCAAARRSPKAPTACASRASTATDKIVCASPTLNFYMCTLLQSLMCIFAVATQQGAYASALHFT